MPHVPTRPQSASSRMWNRRRFLAASSAALMVDRGALSVAGNDSGKGAAAEVIDFTRSYLHCSPTNSGIWVRVQMDCLARLTDITTGAHDDFALGVSAKTGLAAGARTGGRAPGYDYTIIFSKTHVITKRSHSSAYINNPTVLEHRGFGSAEWHLQRAPATQLRTAGEIGDALKNWRQLTAKTTFMSADQAGKYSVEYPIKWADVSSDASAFRVETGPVVLLNPNEFRVGRAPSIADFQWAHLDYRTLNQTRLILEKPTSIFADVTFTPPNEHGRELRENVALTEKQVATLRSAILAEPRAGLSTEAVESLLSTDHYSEALDMAATTEVYAIDA